MEPALRVAIATEPQKAITILVGCLKTAIEAEVSDRMRPHSRIWRSSISGVPSYVRHQSHAQFLISRLRELLGQLLLEGKLELSVVESMARGGNDRLLRRIYLDTLAGSDIPNAETARTILFDDSLFNDPDFTVEFWLFARRHVGKLSELDLVHFVKRIHGDITTPANLDDESSESFLAMRERDRLFSIRDSLATSDLTRLRELEGRFGSSSDMTVGNWPQATTFGPASPIAEDVLARKSMPQIVESLLQWKPAADASVNAFFGPSPEGGSRDLKAIVKDAPSEISVNLPSILRLEATYLRGIVSGLNDAFRAGRELHWPATLELCSWITTRPSEEYAPIGFMGRDSNWTWAKHAVAGLLLDALSRQPSSIPTDFRQQVWTVLENLVEDPDPSENTADDPSQSDYASQAINSVRGTALLAVISYGHWVYTEKFGNALQPEATPTTDLFPEMVAILDRHVDSEQDQSLAIRSVYGQQISLLAAIAYPWVEKQIFRIFGTNPYQHESTRVAWEAYLVFSSITSRTQKLLSEQYTQAVEFIATIPQEKLPSKHDDFEPFKKLVDHVFDQAVFGSAPTMAENVLLARLLEVAPSCFVTHLMWYASKFVNQEASMEVLAKITEYVDSRFKHAQASGDPHAFISELKKFGDWFDENFYGDKEWLLRKTKAILEMFGDIDSCFRVVETMVAWSASYPQLVLDCLELLAANSKDPWSFVGTDSFVLEILQSLRDKDMMYNDQVQRVASHMLRRGFKIFKDL